MRQRKTPRARLAEMLTDKMTAIVGSPIVFRPTDIHSTHSSRRRGMHDAYAWTALAGGVYSVDCYETITDCVRYGFTVEKDTMSRNLAQYDATGGSKEKRR